jgi:hypothetical protein
MASRQVIVVTITAVALLMVGSLGGVLIERMRFDQRRVAVLRQYEERLSERNETLMKIELAQQRAVSLTRDERPMRERRP